MKKRILSLVSIAIFAVAAGWNCYQSFNKNSLSELALSNIDALAAPGEDGGSQVVYRKRFCGGNNNYYKCDIYTTGEVCDGPNRPFPC